MLFANRKPGTGTIRRENRGHYSARAPRSSSLAGRTLATGFTFERDAVRFLDEYVRTGQIPVALLKGAKLARGV